MSSVDQDYSLVEKDYLLAVEEANKYILSGNFLEAKRIISSFIESRNPEGFMYLSLGQICKEIGDEDHSLKAKEYFALAIQSAQEVGDTQVVVAANAALGKMHIQEAMNQFKNLSDVAKGEELKDTLSFVRSDVFSSEFEPKKDAFFLFVGRPCVCNVQTQSNNPPLNGRRSGALNICVFAVCS